VRALSRKSYVNQQDVEELAQITSDYRTLLFPQDTEVAKVLIARFDELVKSLPEPEGDEGEGQGEGQGEGEPQEGTGKGGWSRIPDPNGHKQRQTSEHESGKSRPLSKREQEQARDRLNEREDEDDFDFGDGSGHESEPTDDEPTNGDGGSDSDSESDSSDTDGQGQGEGQGNTDSDSSDSDSDSVSAGTGSATKQLSDALEQVVSDTFERLAEQVADDIAKFNGDVELEGERVSDPKRATFSKRSASPLAVRGSRSFGIELERLKAQHDPAWERKVESGRINAQRYLTTDDLDEVFDRFEQGRSDAVDIEAVILLDTSGSMGGSPIQLASESMWAIKRALDAVNASCTVVGFDYEPQLLFAGHERAETYVRHIGAGGGTQPVSALRYAKNVLANSSRAIKVLFTITDGDWVDSDKSDKLVRQLRDGGVLTALANINTGYGAPSNAHEHEVSVSLNSAGDLFNIARQLVRVGIQRNLVNA
jgi:Mg-chelatase subunit ChlD